MVASPAALESSVESVESRWPVESYQDSWESEGLLGLDRRLVSLCRERGPLRAVLARLASRLVFLQVWERIGFARLSDYAVECLGISGRSVRSLAVVGTKLAARPFLEEALVSGALGWTKVRLLAQLPEEADQPAWIAYARRVTAEELSRAVREVDLGSVEAGAAEEEGAKSRLFEVRCTPEVRGKWFFARGAASRAAGRRLHVSEAAELIAAEVLSAVPIEEEAEGSCGETGVSWSGEAECLDDGPVADGLADEVANPARLRRCSPLRPPWRSARVRTASVPTVLRLAGGVERGPTLDARLQGTRHTEPRSLSPSRETAEAEEAGPTRPIAPAEPGGAAARVSRPSRLPSSAFSSALRPLLEGLEEADAFALDERLRRTLSLEQSLEARIGPLLAPIWGRFLHRALGHRSREAYARERLGMDPTRARALVRLEWAASLSAAFARAYRTGALSWVKASVLAPLVSGELLGPFVSDWVEWAERITVRRLGDDVERALALREMDPVAFRRDGGLPEDARRDREIGAPAMGAGGEHLAGQTAAGNLEANPTTTDREIGAPARGLGGTTVPPARRRIGASSDPLEIRLGRHHLEPLKSAPDEICWARFMGPPDVVQLFQAVLNTVRRRIETDTGRLPTAGDALGVMLDHVLESWGEIDAKVAARHRIFARDGWRCATPGCTSMQNLHDHHIRYRSAQGGDEPENRVTACAFHHLRGIHAGLLRCVGKAPDGLRWEMGLRPGISPRLAYRSGDIRLRAMTAVQ